MEFVHKNWTVQLAGNSIAYWPIASPDEKHFLYNIGGYQSLIKAYLDEVEMKLEEEAELVKQVLQAISNAINSSKFSEQEKDFLRVEQTRLTEAIQGSTGTFLP